MRPISNPRHALPHGPGLRRTVRQHLVQLARQQQGMQLAVLHRCQPRHYVPAPGGQVTASDWQHLLAEFDASLNALRAAYRALLAAEPLVQHLAATWRTQHGVPAAAPDASPLHEPAMWSVLLPAVEQAYGSADALIAQAVTQWSAATQRYQQLLRGQRSESVAQAA